MSDSDPLLTGKHMLVVDDEPLLAYDMADLLQFHGARIAGTCTSLEEAVALIDSGEPIDAAVLDIQIGSEEVWPCARRLSERGIPFLFVSALCGIRPLPAPFADRPYLGKPLDRTRLRDALRKLLGR
jgi:CheY-like chemotaxis protein